ncbi:aquaporin [Bosea sp. PAMC 26642]|uniref:aquaporin n=1 Tax=Bosea sp. (strain PAMC 26642) TaxID=1792307 RepID=UPI0007701ACF|nr:MIP/aquaporin family protein [Bosea sp. PAMC 26642]AMJ61666.1 MIP family channel protein [Bosea sp. PAMC 26642]
MAAIANSAKAASFTLSRRLVAETLGTLLLLAIVIGSGIMGERLSGGNTALALLCNAVATGTGLVVLVTIFSPLSGAHFNPAVTLVAVLRSEIAATVALGYLAAQLAGATLGVWLAHAMFAEPLLQNSGKLRDGPAQMLSEGVATFGLVGAIAGATRFRPETTPWIVGLYITSAYWFTASTSFANPAVTLARSLSDSFAGIAPASVPGFVAAQLFGAVAAFLLFDWLLREKPAS